MSINMDADDVTDYSDFEYQQFSSRLQVNESADATGGSNPGVEGLLTFEPLGKIGGLDNNEVAELVYHELSAAVEWEDETGDQNVATFAEGRGVFGVNLNSANSFPAKNQTVEGEILEATDHDPDNSNVFFKDLNDDRILQLWQTYSSAPFDDAGGGTGGAGAADQFHAEKNWREMTGRGPVLDANDDLSILYALIAGDTIIDVNAVVRGHLVWDVAETSDAGRRFSVPM